MKLSKKMVYILVSFFVIFNIFLRLQKLYFRGYEEGTDSWVYHGLSAQITNEGFANWVIHPLSIFGFYPPGQEVGAMYIYSGSSILTGMDTSITILIISMFFGTTSFLFVFLFSREIFKDHFFGLILAVTFSTSNIVVGTTTWTFSTRGIFSLLLPLFMFLVFKLRNKENSNKYLLLIILFIIPFSTIHRNIIFIIVLIVILVITYIIIKVNKKIKNKSYKNKWIDRGWRLIFLGLFIFFIISSYYEIFISMDYSPGKRIIESEFINAIYDIGFQYSIYWGISIVFLPIGLINIYKIKKFNFGHIFILIGFLGFGSFIFDTAYANYFFNIITITIICFGIYYFFQIIEKRKSRLFSFIFILFILFLISIAPAYLQVESDPKVKGFKSEERWISADYIHYYLDKNEKIIYGFGLKEAAIGGLAEQNYWTDIEIDSIKSRTTKDLNFTYFFESRNLFQIKELWSTSLNLDIYHCDDQKTKIGLNKYSNVYVMVNTNFYEKSFESYDINRLGEMWESKFIKSVNESRYSIYKTDNHCLFWVQSHQPISKLLNQTRV